MLFEIVFRYNCLYTIDCFLLYNIKATETLMKVLSDIKIRVV